MEDPDKNWLLSRRRVLGGLAGGIGAIAAASTGVSVAQGENSNSKEISSAHVTVDCNKRLGAMNIDRFSLGQGGLSPEPMFADRTAEIRALRPRVIRLFVQEYYELMPALGEYHFTTLDRSVDSILQCGATPLLSIVFKPKLLFPRIDFNLAEPTSWADWDALVYNLVRHYKERNGNGWYWEVGNEWNRPDGGGTPYHMTPAQYTEFYRHTIAAVRRADPEAHVGGPGEGDGAAASALIPPLLTFCETNKLPLDFVSWHHYPNDPQWFRQSIQSMKSLLRQHPGLHPETVIDEWNMGTNTDPRIQPIYIAESTLQMIEAGLDLSCYYHIRDYPMVRAEFAKFYPESGIPEIELYWDRDSVGFGMFDFENHVRPAYYLFRLLSRLTGERLDVTSTSGNVHALATFDAYLKASSILIWNYSDKPVVVDLHLANLSTSIFAKRFVLDAAGPGYGDMARLHPLPGQKLSLGDREVSFRLDPWGISSLSLEQR